MNIADPGNPVNPSLPPDARALAINFFLATWAVSLVQKDNILGLTLRSGTITQYLRAAAKLIVARGNPNPLEGQAGKWTNLIISKLEKYEGIPDRREAFTDEMIDAFHKRATISQADDLAACLYDWIALGRYTGFRRSEWAQSRKNSYERVSPDVDEAKALIASDLLFFDSRGHLIEKAAPLRATLYRVDIRWRCQKNGDNGQVISFWRDDVNPIWCPVCAAWRICQRAKRFGLPANEPIGKYQDYHNNKIAFLNTPEIESFIRDVAKKTTGLKDEALIQRMFGLHSIRVTACNELDRLGVNDTFIQRRLRWKSLTFATYLRNTIYAARRHNLSNIHVSVHDKALAAARIHHSVAHRALLGPP